MTMQSHPGSFAAPEPLDYAGAPRRRRGFRGFLNVVTVLGVVLIGITFLLPSLCRSSETANRVKSASNLRQVGQAIQIYSTENTGTYPPDFPTLLMTEDVTADVFVSPRSNDTAAEGPTTRAIADQVVTPGHCSYTYLGNGLTSKSVPDSTVVAYETPADALSGGNVLFGDGHVEWFEYGWFTKLKAELATRPPASTQPVVMASE